jgi:hypothetical protein
MPHPSLQRLILSPVVPTQFKLNIWLLSIKSSQSTKEALSMAKRNEQLVLGLQFDRSTSFVLCPVAVYSMILCSVGHYEWVAVPLNELSLSAG